MGRVSDAHDAPRLTRRRLLLGGSACAVCAAGGVVVGRLSASSRAQPTKNNSTRTRSNRSRVLVQPDGLFNIQTDEPIVALTFDDGPDPKYTPQVMRQLDRANARATFFLIGVNAAAHPDLVAAHRRGGHSIGNHTYDHRDLELLGADQVDVEIERAQRALIAAGARRPSLFRPPKGYTDDVVGVLADAHRYRTVFWDACVERFVNHVPVEEGVKQLLAKIRPGSIVLAHDGGTVTGSGRPPLSRVRTMEALPMILAGLAAMGLEVVDVPELLRRTGTPLLPSATK